MSVRSVVRAKFRNECLRKQYYETLADAEAQLARMKSEGWARDPERLHVYECSFARHWHVGHI